MLKQLQAVAVVVVIMAEAPTVELEAVQMEGFIMVIILEVWLVRFLVVGIRGNGVELPIVMDKRELPFKEALARLLAKPMVLEEEEEVIMVVDRAILQLQTHIIVLVVVVAIPIQED
jgi:hypothetical protein